MRKQYMICCGIGAMARFIGPFIIDAMQRQGSEFGCNLFIEKGSTVLLCKNFH